jgi:rod shape-determining protein MreB
MFLNSLLALFSNDMGMDLGTCNTLVYVKGQGIILFEPSVVAISKGTNKVLAVGNRAKEMLGRTPGHIVAIRPMRDGVIADFEVTEQMLRSFITKVHHRRAWVHPRMVIAIPSGGTEVEKRAVVDSAERAGASEVYLVEEPMAASIGSGLPISEPAGNMIVDIGGGTTEVAVISLSGVVLSQTMRIGGDEMDEAIIQHLKRTHNLLVGERTAEEIKMRIGSGFPLEEELKMEAKGRDLVSGLPKTVTVSSEEVREALSEPVNAVVETVRDTLERTPPELSSDLVDRGIYLTGGGALLRGMDKLLASVTDIPIHVTEDPLTTVVMGTGKILDELSTLREVLISKHHFA